MTWPTVLQLIFDFQCRKLNIFSLILVQKQILQTINDQQRCIFYLEPLKMVFWSTLKNSPNFSADFLCETQLLKRISYHTSRIRASRIVISRNKREEKETDCFAVYFRRVFSILLRFVFHRVIFSVIHMNAVSVVLNELFILTSHYDN